MKYLHVQMMVNSKLKQEHVIIFDQMKMYVQKQSVYMVEHVLL
jgi:hypothetical protein